METAQAEAVTARRAFPFTEKQIMSLFGFVPLGVYVVLHLWTNLYSLAGAEAWEDALVRSRNHPAFLALEIGGLGLPLLVHTWYGLKIIWKAIRGTGNTLHYGYFRNLKFWLQRLSGLGLAVFLGAHIYLARIVPATTPVGHETFEGLSSAMHEWDTFTVYCLGILGISYHLANGMWSFLMTWGITVTPRAQKRAELLSVAFFLILLFMGGLSIYGFLRV